MTSFSAAEKQSIYHQQTVFGTCRLQTCLYGWLLAKAALAHTPTWASLLQIHRQFRKPLIVVAPKNLLRHPDAKSGLWEFDDKADDKGILGVRFKRLIMDASAEDR